MNNRRPERDRALQPLGRQAIERAAREPNRVEHMVEDRRFAHADLLCLASMIVSDHRGALRRRALAPLAWLSPHVRRRVPGRAPERAMRLRRPRPAEPSSSRLGIGFKAVEDSDYGCLRVEPTERAA